MTGHKAQGPDRLLFLRTIDQELAERHHSGLRYPATLLAQALALSLRGETLASAVRRVLKRTDSESIEIDEATAIADAFYVNLKATPRLRPGVAEGLSALHRAGYLVIVITEGAKDRVLKTIVDLGLSAWIDRIIEAPKQTELYRRVGQLSDAPLPMFMVGDQLQRDMVPAKAAGLGTIYFPGEFNPRWEPSEDEVRPDHRIGDFRDVVSIVAKQQARYEAPLVGARALG